MIDIHTHILPCVDDGANFFDVALKMIELEISNNVEEIILTPHYFHNEFSSTDLVKINNQFDILQEKCKGLNIKLTLGAEIYYSKEVYNEFINHNVVTLGDTKYVLIEFSLYQNYFDIVSIVDELVYLGYKPIIAHAERYNYLSISDIDKIRKLGGFIQINTTSINGSFGLHIKKKVHYMLKKGYVDFVASDCHNLENRKPDLKECLEYIKKKYKLEFMNDIYGK